MYRNSSPKKRLPFKSLILALSIVAVLVFVWIGLMSSRTTSSNPTSGNMKSTIQSTSAPTFDKTAYSTSDPASIGVVVNKQRPLNPKNYVPNDLTTPNIPLKSAKTAENMQVRAPMAKALETMVAAAEKDNIHLLLASGYRSYTTQVSVYSSEVKAYGQAKADTESARPGYSEHQTGWAADVGSISHKCEIAACFGTMPEAAWLAANAWKYGFIIRYPQGKTNITGYTYEPWHVRYIGTDLSSELHRQNVQTLEEFFGLRKAPDY